MCKNVESWEFLWFPNRCYMHMHMYSVSCCSKDKKCSIFRQFSEYILEKYSVHFQPLLKHSFVEGVMKVFHFCGIFQVFLWHGYINIKNNNSNVVDHAGHSVLWHSMKNLVNFMRHLTSKNLICFAKMKPLHCSGQYRARSRGRDFVKFQLHTVNLFHISSSTSILQELSRDLLIFIYTTFEFRICLRYEPYTFQTQIFTVVFFYNELCVF